ncbi:MAG TPA: class I SAM-dependent methyltransferase [Micromonosporaceae bacterium]
MTYRTTPLTDELRDYLLAHSTPPDELARDLIAETQASVPDRASMQVAPEQARLLTLLTRICGARYAVEVGTFTGFSALAIARGLPADGKLICCDVSEEYTAIARRYWARAGVDDRIELRLGPAADTLRAMPAEPHVDLAFIDANKTGYLTYWSELVPRVRSGGVVLVDNVLWKGRVLAPESPDDHAVVEFNKHVVADDRVELVILPIGDGMTLARKK